MKWLPYPKYKPSGVQWIGDVPEHWQIWKTTHGFRMLGSGTTPRSDDTDYYDGHIPWVTTSELRETVILNTATKVTTAAVRDYPTLRLYPEGTLLFAMYGATIGRLGILGIAATVNQACAAFAYPIHLDTQFTYYWLQMRRPTLVMLSAGGGQPNLSQDDLRQIRVPAPSREEQRAIADFLDRETTKLDTLVAKKRTLIERLREKRNALISSTVTRGLPPDAARAAGLDPYPKLKPSGIDWLGDVPEHWKIIRIGRMIVLQRGVDITKDEQNEGYVPVVSSGGVASFHDQALARGPGVVVGRKGTAGVVYFVSVDFWPHDTTLWVKEFFGNYPRFVYFKLLSMDLSSFDTGSANPTVNRNLVHPVVVSWPPVPEQRAIAYFLDHEVERIEALIAKIESAIARLQEYRTALITAAVTGKIDVRHQDVRRGTSHAPAALS